MSDFEKELFDSLSDLDDKSVHFSQLGSIQESSLSQLRDQIKKVMIPLLIKTFQSQLDLIPSSRSPLEDSAFKETYEQLKTLDHDLKNLQQWCQSCRSQIQRALNLPDEEKSISATSNLETHPRISKSFAEAMNVKSCCEENSSFKGKEPSLPPSQSSEKKWWRVLLKR